MATSFALIQSLHPSRYDTCMLVIFTVSVGQFLLDMLSFLRFPFVFQYKFVLSATDAPAIQAKPISPCFVRCKHCGKGANFSRNKHIHPGTCLPLTEVMSSFADSNHLKRSLHSAVTQK